VVPFLSADPLEPIVLSVRPPKVTDFNIF
jgi:hypothetical protein